ncbi:MAG: C-terminal helicase domain-containing protein, partial [Bacteroidetes bacterium]|nr:C-terminal helicase domain-containing protein [Bacteroidota bacterium]
YAMSLFREGAIRVLFSTDVSSRGRDVPETKLVINCTVPRNSADYVHRIGRTGRAFREGVAHTLYDPSEEYYLGAVEKHLPSKNIIRAVPMPEEVLIEDTQPAEAKQMAMDIDLQKRKADPTFQGAFHERKNKKSLAKSRQQRSARRRK